MYLFSDFRKLKLLYLEENSLEGKFSIDLALLNLMYDERALSIIPHTLYEMRRPSLGMWKNLLMSFIINYVCSSGIREQIM